MCEKCAETQQEKTMVVMSDFMSFQSTMDRKYFVSASSKVNNARNQLSWLKIESDHRSPPHVFLSFCLDVVGEEIDRTDIRVILGIKMSILVVCVPKFQSFKATDLLM